MQLSNMKLNHKPDEEEDENMLIIHQIYTSVIESISLLVNLSFPISLKAFDIFDKVSVIASKKRSDEMMS